jgi:PKD repeat protein
MQSIGRLFVATGTLLLAWACGGGGGVTPPTDNAAPVANFAVPSCVVGAPCNFISTSTDDVEVTGWSWDFDGDGHSDANTASASFIYETDGDFTVSLTVRDIQGLTHTKTSTITIGSASNTSPTAGFTHTCNAVDCSFISTSTDVAPGTIATYAWTFGDGAADNVSNPSHSYSVTTPTDFTVTLTVTDNEGATDVETQTVSVAPAPNTPPTAGFSYTCHAASCDFTSTSTDVAPGIIASYAWTFGDGATAQLNNPSHSYNVTTTTDFTVTLTVTDNEGATDVETQTVSINPVNTPPTASFTFSCNAAICSFASTSTDAAPDSITTYAWTFGDGGTANVSNPLHNYAITAPTDFTVTLTVTDNEGLTGVATQTVSVAPAPPAAEGCVTSGTKVDCALNITARSFIKLKLLGLSCGELSGERVIIPAPIGDQTFLNVCFRAVGDSTRIFGGPHDTSIIFEPGSQAVIRFVQGTADGGQPVPGSPAAHLTGTFPNWTINFEDGANPAGAGEPDFIDVVLGVEAVAVP